MQCPYRDSNYYNPKRTKKGLETERYLAKILEVGSKHILHIWWVRSINLIPEGPKKPIRFMLSSEISHVIMQPVEIEELVKDSACNWMIFLLPQLSS